MAMPQVVATKMWSCSAASSGIDIPQAEGVAVQPGFDVAGLLHVVPPSELTQIPPRLITRLSWLPAAITMLALRGSKLTSNEPVNPTLSTWTQLPPPLLLLKIPPSSEAA